jgi:excisionase family DNA binding protein
MTVNATPVWETRVEFLTTEEVATLLRTTPETVRYWRHANKGPRSFKVGRRVLYAARDVEAFISAARGDRDGAA